MTETPSRPGGAAQADGAGASHASPDAGGPERPGLPAKLWAVAWAATGGYFADGCRREAAGIAYRVLFAVAPLAIVLVSIFGLVLQDDDVRETVLDAIVQALPLSGEGRADVEEALSTIATPGSAAGLASVLLLAWAASGMMTAVRQGLESAMGVTETRRRVRGKLVDLALVMGAGILVLLTAAVTVLGDVARSRSTVFREATGVESGAVVAVLSRGAVFALSVGVVLLLYRFVPARGLRLRDGLAGAIATAVLLQVISFLSAWIYAKTTQLSFIYGSFTVGLVFLYSIYLYASALLLGAEIAAAWARDPQEPLPTVAPRMRREAFRLAVKKGLAHVRRSGPAPDDLL